MENVQRLRSKLSTLNEAIKFLDQDIIQKDSLIKWANQYSKDLESSESELIERFGLDLEQELKKIGMTLSGHYPELKAGFFTIETNFTKKQVTLWYGPKQDALTKCKLVPHDVIKCMEKCRHQLGSRVSENDFLEKLYKAYSRTGEGKIFEKSPIIKVLAEIAFLIQKPIFYSVHDFINTLTYYYLEKHNFLWHDGNTGGCPCQEKPHMRLFYRQRKRGNYSGARQNIHYRILESSAPR